MMQSGSHYMWCFSRSRRTNLCYFRLLLRGVAAKTVRDDKVYDSLKKMLRMDLKILTTHRTSLLKMCTPHLKKMVLMLHLNTMLKVFWKMTEVVLTKHSFKMLKVLWKMMKKMVLVLFERWWKLFNYAFAENAKSSLTDDEKDGIDHALKDDDTVDDY